MRAEQWDAVYARQSVEKKDSLSISGQIALCRRAAERLGLRFQLTINGQQLI